MPTPTVARPATPSAVTPPMNSGEGPGFAGGAPSTERSSPAATVTSTVRLPAPCVSVI